MWKIYLCKYKYSPKSSPPWRSQVGVKLCISPNLNPFLLLGQLLSQSPWGSWTCHARACYKWQLHIKLISNVWMTVKHSKQTLKRLRGEPPESQERNEFGSADGEASHVYLHIGLNLVTLCTFHLWTHVPAFWCISRCKLWRRKDMEKWIPWYSRWAACRHTEEITVVGHIVIAMYAMNIEIYTYPIRWHLWAIVFMI